MKNTKNNVPFILGTLTICIIFPVISFYIDYNKAFIQYTEINTYCWKIETGILPTEVDRKEL
ncbi:hypothetical protein KBC86_04435, partial [Candidatus Gracilibacteria bacterium]|nr:hypothetical protein [Candidatus Gracilibacteria bacterium]